MKTHSRDEGLGSTVNLAMRAAFYVQDIQLCNGPHSGNNRSRKGPMLGLAQRKTETAGESLTGSGEDILKGPQCLFPLAEGFVSGFQCLLTPLLQVPMLSPCVTP